MDFRRWTRLASILVIFRLVRAYIDPGSFGVIAQVGYVALFGALSALLFFFRPIKALFYRLTGREPEPCGTDSLDSDEDSDEAE